MKVIKMASSISGNIRTLLTLACLQSYFKIASADIVCPTAGSSQQGTSCFLASRFYTSWTEAFSFCSSLGCSLAAPENTIKSTEIRDYARSVNLFTKFYLGGTDANSEGTFVLAGSGRPLVALNWAAGEPGGGARENCLHTDHVDTFNMYDTSCEEERRFICDCPTQEETRAQGLEDLV